MTINKRLFSVVIALIPIAVISFIFKDRTNFNLEEKSDNIEQETVAQNESAEITVRLLRNGNIEILELEDYLIHVVAGEMPASFEMDALKAQAVASRSYALYRKKTNSGTYDLTDNTTTQVYISDADMQKKWGADFDKYYNRVRQAVEETKGEVALYNGDIIEALYFSMSGGLTQNVEAVFGEKLEYLQKVESPYDKNTITGFQNTKTFSQNDLKEKLGISCRNISVDKLEYNSSRYVDEIEICGKIFDGNAFRDTLGLRSANFDIDIKDNVEITTYGFGHGVGMSQYGANGYALNGYDYKSILKHYYKNVEIANIKDV